MRPKSFADMRCSIAGASEMVGDKWTILVLRDLALGLRRYDDLRASMGIPTTTLARRLKTLEAHGIVERGRYRDRPPRDEYRLTEKGRDFWKVATACGNGATVGRHGHGAPTLEVVDTHTGRALQLALIDPWTGHAVRANGPRLEPGPGADDTVRAPSRRRQPGRSQPMTATIEFYFDFQSPYSYLAHSQLGTLGAPVRLVPISVLPLMKLVNNTPTTITCSVKRAYAGKDLGRWAARYGVPVIPPAREKMDGDLLLRVATAAQGDAVRAAVVGAIFNAVWAAQGDPSPASLEATLGARGLPAAELIAAADGDATVKALESATDAAAARGVFGAPTIFVGDEMFFGNDRLDFVRESLAPKEMA